MSVTVEELIEAKRDMEERIFIAVRDQLYNFRQKTGMTPCDITVQLQSTQFLGQENPVHSVYKVTSSIDIG